MPLTLTGKIGDKAVHNCPSLPVAVNKVTTQASSVAERGWALVTASRFILGGSLIPMENTGFVLV
jgi:hypothetical protein